MKKFLVISYYNGNLNIDLVASSYEKAKEWMDDDVKEFISPMKLDEVDESKCWIGSHSAFANTDEAPCDWVIKSIEV